MMPRDDCLPTARSVADATLRDRCPPEFQHFAFDDSFQFSLIIFAAYVIIFSEYY